jgi:hypothetical protein
VADAETPLLSTTEFSRRLGVEPWPEAGVEVAVTADPVERQALARRFDLVEVAALRGHGKLERRDGAGELVFRGWLDAHVVQSCVLSLEPVAAAISQRVERRYRPRVERSTAPRRPVAVDLDDDDEVAWLSGREIDFGEVFAEALGLALDPYPRAPGARVVVAEASGSHVTVGGAVPSTAFAALERMQDQHPR